MVKTDNTSSSDRRLSIFFTDPVNFSSSGYPANMGHRYPGYPDNITATKPEYPGQWGVGGSDSQLTVCMAGLYDQSLYNGASQGISDFQARMSAFGAAGFAGLCEAGAD